MFLAYTFFVAWMPKESLEQALHEKDQKLLRMGDEINRLAVFEQVVNIENILLLHPWNRLQ